VSALPGLVPKAWRVTPARGFQAGEGAADVVALLTPFDPGAGEARRLGSGSESMAERAPVLLACGRGSGAGT
jgi:hypothetical protein